jgi:hypothetical protein
LVKVEHLVLQSDLLVKEPKKQKLKIYKANR